MDKKSHLPVRYTQTGRPKPEQIKGQGKERKKLGRSCVEHSKPKGWNRYGKQRYPTARVGTEAWKKNTMPGRRLLVNK
jgi:hypothetical protein